MQALKPILQEELGVKKWSRGQLILVGGSNKLVVGLIISVRSESGPHLFNSMLSWAIAFILFLANMKHMKHC